MRFAWVLAAMAVLWVQPARAVEIVDGVYSGVITSGSADLTNASAESFLHADLTGLSIYFAFSSQSDPASRVIASISIPDAVNTNMRNFAIDTAPVPATAPVTGDGQSIRIFAALTDPNINYMQFDLIGPVDEGVINSFVGNIAGSQLCGNADCRRVVYSLYVNLTGFGKAVGSVPEPATWALMILGIGMAGAGMRRSHPPYAVAMAGLPKMKSAPAV